MDNPKSLFNNNTKVCENCKRISAHDALIWHYSAR